jgi:hypothetical protein
VNATPCPGSCNNAWRLAEAALATDGTPHDIPVTWGQPVHCPRCASRTHTQLLELPELIVAISLEALHGTAPKQTGTIGRASVASWPGQAARLMTDLVVGGLLELEDDIRELRGFRHRPGRGTEARNAAGAVQFLTAHLDWALVEHPCANEIHGHNSGNPASQISSWHRAAQRFTRRDARLEQYKVPCPRCDLLTLYRSDADDYISCRNLNCQILLTPGEYHEHTKRLADQARMAKAA